MKIFLLRCLLILNAIVIGFGAIGTLSWMAGLEFIPIHRGPELVGWLVMGSAVSYLAFEPASRQVLDLLGIP